jgi:hypothetical protein
VNKIISVPKTGAVQAGLKKQTGNLFEKTGAMILIGFQYPMMITSQTELQVSYSQESNRKRNRKNKFKTSAVSKQVSPVRQI